MSDDNQEVVPIEETLRATAEVVGRPRSVMLNKAADEIERLRKDAERYRWLRDDPPWELAVRRKEQDVPSSRNLDGVLFVYLDGMELDEAIDAATARKGAGMTDPRQAMQMALRIIELRRNAGNKEYDRQAEEAAQALRAALSAQQEPANPDPLHLSRILHELAGAASLCWEPKPAGEFDAQKAIGFVEAAIAEIRQRMAYTHPAPTVQPLTDEQIDRMLSAPIPGGSQARDWFLPHEHEQGLRNVRVVVREMLRAHGIGGPNAS